MEALTAVVLRAKHGPLIADDADVLVPFGWTALVSSMLGKLAATSAAESALIVVRGLRIDDDGLLDVDATLIEGLMTSAEIDEVEAIIKHARDLAAWSCVRDHQPGWIVHAPSGTPRPLCPACQHKVGLRPEAHHAQTSGHPGWLARHCSARLRRVEHRH